jgi:hypothetical protein
VLLGFVPAASGGCGDARGALWEPAVVIVGTDGAGPLDAVDDQVVEACRPVKLAQYVQPFHCGQQHDPPSPDVRPTSPREPVVLLLVEQGQGRLAIADVRQVLKEQGLVPAVDAGGRLSLDGFVEVAPSGVPVAAEEPGQVEPSEVVSEPRQTGVAHELQVGPGEGLQGGKVGSGAELGHGP